MLLALLLGITALRVVLPDVIALSKQLHTRAAIGSGKGVTHFTQVHRLEFELRCTMVVDLVYAGLTLGGNHVTPHA
jgi:transposase